MLGIKLLAMNYDQSSWTYLPKHNQTEILEVSNFEWKLTTNHFDFFSKLIFASNFDYNKRLYTMRDVYVVFF